ncbi:zf-HC2 domain-containing protein [Candidatus Aminicenantes bacterium AC-335-A11]|jgi:hypothetical protein|nr:zf-HC2 domain-containing protein [SCandidatus Aminicenantes bacterium Aminicenantia_JdfR_composite]MCP2598348.1 zf-HC2 domain-containing protein [Candidatus Aminicenantes bacterium AC-335-L06]MCP2618592.1 zf-HC2 domain-containing protein [Candidatus Aminicenantes bacterium AC-335-A11]
MRKCRKIRKLLISFYLEELSYKKINFVKNHLKECEDCFKEFKNLKILFENLEDNKREINETINTINWENIPSMIMRRIEREIIREKRVYHLKIMKLNPILTAVISLIIIIGITILILFQPWSKKHFAKNEFFVSSSSFENMEYSVARKETVEYLKQSQLLLTDLMKFTSPEEVDPWTIDLTSKRAKDLLIQKKYFDEKLDSLSLMKARRICNQIEFLFYDVIQLKEQPDFENIKKIQQIIEKEQLLFRIRLIEKELS